MMTRSPEQDAQTLVEHLTELRSCVVRSLVAIFIGFGICWNFGEQIMEIIRLPIVPYLKTGGGLVFLGVTDKFIAQLKVCFLAGVIISCPFWLHQVWRFVAPALYENEKRYAIGFIFFGSLLFMTGVAFAYFLVFPAAFNFLLNFGGTADVPMITLSDYLSFFVTSTLVFGGAFELPLILVSLGMMGIIDDKMLRSKRRFAIVILAVVSAILTPPDALSMTMLLIPLVGLYEMSIILVRGLVKKSATSAELIKP